MYIGTETNGKESAWSVEADPKKKYNPPLKYRLLQYIQFTGHFLSIKVMQIRVDKKVESSGKVKV